MGRAMLPVAGAHGLGVALMLLLSGCSAARHQKPAREPQPERTGAEEASEPEATSQGDMSPEAAKLYAAGMEAYGNADLKSAGERFERALAVDPRAYAALVGLASVQERRGEPDKAVDSYQAALAIAPDYGPALAGEVRLLLAKGRTAEADALVRGAAAKYPDNAAVLTARAEVSSVRGDSVTAQQLAQRALKKDPDYRPAMLTLARDHYRARRLDLALYTLTAILDGYGQENPPRDKNNAEARLLRALIYGERGRRKAAMDELAAAIEARPDLVEARLLLSAYMLEAGNATEARPILEKALEYDPSNVFVHLNLGDAYRLLGKPKDALDHLQWVARRDETLAMVHYNIGLVYLLSSDLPGVSEKDAIDLAIGSFEQFKKLEPRAAKGAGDDVDDLLTRARNKKAILDALATQPEAPQAAPGADGTAPAPAAEGTPAAAPAQPPAEGTGSP